MFELLDIEEADGELTVSESVPLLLLKEELDPATLELLDDKEAVIDAEEVVLVTEVVVVVTMFPA
jgi:hypothetical protein